MIKTLKISGVTKADLTTSNNRERYAWVKNNTGGNVYASVLDSTCTAGADNVAEIAAGDVRMVDTLSLGYLWLSGNGAVEIQLSDSVVCPFKLSQKGGDVSAEGDSVQLGGLQGGVPFSEVTVKGKNLINYPYYNTTMTKNGITYTDNDGTITADGTATEISAFYFANKISSFPADRKYFLSGCPVGGSNTTYDIIFIGLDENGTVVDAYNDVGNGKTFTVSQKTKTVNLYIRIQQGVTVNNLVFRPMLELGDTATEYVPPITGQELTVTACGKNLAKYPYINTTKTTNGITFTDNNGTITANGTATDTATFTISRNFGFGREGDYRLSGCPAGGGLNTYYINWYQNHEGVTQKNYNDYGNGVTVPYEHIFSAANSLSIAIISGTVCNNLVFKPMIEIGSTATAYEPYSGADYAITPDSNPYTVPTEIYQQDGVNTIYVTGEGEPTLSVKGIKENAAVKKIWDKLNELTTAIIVSNGEI